MSLDRIGCPPLKSLLLCKRLVSKVKHSSLVLSFIQLPSLAVRKNRYVVLPIDFEEAWKVSQFVVIL
jgi:hypothetical protein